VLTQNNVFCNKLLLRADSHDLLHNVRVAILGCQNQCRVACASAQQQSASPRTL
jgi:hypothetical protein